MKYALFFSIILVCLGAVTGFVVVTASPESPKIAGKITPTPTPRLMFYGGSRELPDEILYDIFFQQVNSFWKKDLESISTNQRTDFKNSFYKYYLKLETPQFSALDNAAQNVSIQLKPIEKKARKVVEEYRANYPDGKLKRNPPPKPENHPFGIKLFNAYAKLLPIPEELEKLQDQKNQIISNELKNIKISLGRTEFEEFEEALKKHYGVQLSPTKYRGREAVPFPKPTPPMKR